MAFNCYYIQIYPSCRVWILTPRGCASAKFDHGLFPHLKAFSLLIRTTVVRTHKISLPLHSRAQGAVRPTPTSQSRIVERDQGGRSGPIPASMSCSLAHKLTNSLPNWDLLHYYGQALMVGIKCSGRRPYQKSFFFCEGCIVGIKLAGTKSGLSCGLASILE